MLQHLLKIVTAFVMLAVLILLVQLNGLACDLTELFAPGWGRVAWLVCAGLELAALVWLGLACFARPSRLLLREDPSEAERQAFAAELTQRLSTNRLVREAGLDPSAADFLPQALALLDERADAVIRSDAKKVFLGTALSQNGRLDALIVFVALCRMVWKVSGIYNQRPSLQEIWSVYHAVSSATFLAFSIEALDIPRTVTESMSALVPAAAPSLATASVPLVGASVQFFTTAAIDGAANSLLAIRAGMSTKHAFRHAALDEEDARQAGIRDSAAMLLAISGECLNEVVAALRGQLWEMGKSAGGSLRNAASSVSEGVCAAGSAAASAVTRGSEAVVDAVDSGITATLKAAGTATSATVGAVSSAASAVGSGMRSAASSVSEGVCAAGSAAASAVTRGSGAVVDAVDSGITATLKAAGTATSATVGAVSSAASAVGSGMRSAASSVSEGVCAAGSAAASAVTRGSGAVVDAVDSGITATLKAAGTATSATVDAVSSAAGTLNRQTRRAVSSLGKTARNVLPWRRRSAD